MGFVTLSISNDDRDNVTLSLDNLSFRDIHEISGDHPVIAMNLSGDY